MKIYKNNVNNNYNKKYIINKNINDIFLSLNELKKIRYKMY